MRPALIADWLVTYGGAEHVIAELHALYPDAPLFTTVAKKHALGPLKDMDIRTSGLQKWYRLTHQHQMLLPWMPRAIESMDLTGFDLIISSSHAVGKGIVPPSNALHVCYCHTPVRYAWEMEDQYLDDFHIPQMLRARAKHELKKLRRWDMTSAKRVDVFIANSTTTQERIKRIYGRDSVVVPPPVEDRFFKVLSSQFSATSNGRKTENSQLKTDNYFLSVGRLVPYKRFDLLIHLANKLQLPLKIAGRGQDEKRLKKLAGPTVEFLGFVSDAELPGLYAHAKALLFPQYEDAGIVPLEAQACGTPVIAYGTGGALDSVKDGETGVFFDAQTEASIADALKRFEKIIFDREKIRAHAQQFSQAHFREKFTKVVTEAYGEFKAGTFKRI